MIDHEEITTTIRQLIILWMTTRDHPLGDCTRSDSN